MSLPAIPAPRRAAITAPIRWAFWAMASRALVVLVCTPSVIVAWSGVTWVSPWAERLSVVAAKAGSEVVVWAPAATGAAKLPAPSRPARAAVRTKLFMIVS